MQVLVDVRLEVGSQTERIVVEAAAPQLQTQSSSVGAVVDNRTIINMPLIDRRAAQLARLNGFVVQNGNGSNFTMAGGRGDNSMWLIDGANAQNVLLGVQTLSFDPPIEALQEFNVSISNYAAELGRTGGGVVQMTTKSGTNEFHGSAYEYLRNDALDARTFFSETKPKLRYNLFGASLGGPIRKDRTHFFFSYEGRRQIDENARLQNVPTPAEVRGDFSASSRIIRDPAAAGRPPFPGNIIPTSRLDPIGQSTRSILSRAERCGARFRRCELSLESGRPQPAERLCRPHRSRFQCRRPYLRPAAGQQRKQSSNTAPGRSRPPIHSPADARTATTTCRAHGSTI